MSEAVTHITRSNEPVHNLLGRRFERDWHWVLGAVQRSINKKVNKPGSTVVFPDTVLFENGVPSVWLYTSIHGELLLKSQKACTIENLRKKFRSNNKYACVVTLNTGEQMCWTKQELQDTNSFETVVSIQKFVEAKSGVVSTGSPANYRHEYTLLADGRPQMNSFRLGAPTATTTKGETRRETIRSRNTVVNERMDTSVLSLINLVERATRCKVLKLVTDFIVDRGDRSWISFVDEASVAEDRASVVMQQQHLEALRKSSVSIAPPSNFLQRKTKNSRNEKLAQQTEEENNAMRDWGLDADADITEIADIALLRTGRRRSTISDRERRRSLAVQAKHTEMQEKEAREAAIMQQDLVRSLNTTPVSEKLMSSSAAARPTSPKMRLLETNDPAKTVGEQLDKASNVLLSSQDSKCPGDFCHIKLEVDTGQSEESSEAAMRRLASLEMTDELLPERPLSGAELTNTVSYKSVVQARAEKRLVELLIKRMQRKETGEYVQSVDDLEPSSLSKDFPVHYYRQINVCERCFILYSKIEDARQKSLAKFDPKYIDTQKKLKLLKKKQTEEDQKLLLQKQSLSVVDSVFRDQRVHPFSSEGKKLMKKSFQELKLLAVERSRQAVQTLTKSDLTEFRSFQNPPSGVIQVTQALMLLLTGKMMTWEAAKRVMANGDRFIAMLSDFEPDLIPCHRLTDLEPFVKDPAFRPNTLLHVSKSAAVFCEYVLGNIQANKYMSGKAHPRSDPLLFLDETEPILESTSRATTAEEDEIHGDARLAENGSFMVTIPKYLQDHIQRTQNLQTVKRPDAVGTPLERKLELQREVLRSRKDDSRRPNTSEDGKPAPVNGDTPVVTTPTGSRKRRGKRPRSGDNSAGNVLDVPPPPSAGEMQLRELNLTDVMDSEYATTANDSSQLLSPTGWSRAQHRAMAGTRVAFNRHESINPPSRPMSRAVNTASTGSSSASNTVIPLNGFADDEQAMEFLRQQLQKQEDLSKTTRKLTRRERVARKKMQERQMERLHGAVVKDPNEETSAGTDASCLFSCSDGITSLPYDVVGVGGIEGETPNIVVVHDLFDTYESIQIFLEPVMRKYQGSQALVFNYAGQAYTTFPDETKNVLNNVFHAATLHELLGHVEKNGEFSCSIKPFYILGIGNGANIASYFACEYAAKLSEYRRAFRGLVSFNGFSHVDEQLAAILHSSVNVFSCFPPTRPDLPISYFTRFLFSDEYLQKVDPSLVLNIYTAVGNPITLQGRVQLCSGSLKHKDVREQLKDLPIPVVVVQATENVLVNPNNVDPFLDGRQAQHLWSHQLKDTGGKLGAKGFTQMKQCLERNDGAFVVWLKSGHEIRQEQRVQVLDVIETLFATSPPISFSGLSKPVKPESIDLKKKTKKKKKKKKTAKKQEKLIPVEVESTKTPETEQHEKEEEEKDESDTPETKDEFEEAMQRHRETKRLTEEARALRLRQLQEQAELEQEQVRLRHEALEKERLLKEDEERKRFELEMEQRKAQQEAELAKALEIKQAEMMQQVEEERTKAKLLSEKLQNELLEKQKEQMEEKLKLEKLRKSIESGGLDYDRVVNKDPPKVEEKEESVVDTTDVRYQIEQLKKEQELRRKQWELEDQRRIAQLEKQLQLRAKSRDANARETQKVFSQYVVRDAGESVPSTVPVSVPLEQQNSVVPSLLESSVKSSEKPEQQEQQSLGEALGVPNSEPSVMEQAELAAAELINTAKQNATSVQSVQVLDTQEYEQVKRELEEAETKRVNEEKERAAVQQGKIENVCAVTIQRVARGRIGRLRFHRIRRERETSDTKYIAACTIQAVQRGIIGRQKAEVIKQLVLRDRMEKSSCMFLQRVARGMLGRNKARTVRRDNAVLCIQGFFRQMLASMIVEARRTERDQQLKEFRCASLIQSVFRMYQGREQFIHFRILQLAATQIQRVYRGCRGRRKAERKRTWANSEPGPERLELGLSLIEESKAAFSAQQEEIDALHRAQERAETRVSKIHAGLEESEKELFVLEQELRDVDHLDEVLHQLSHEKALQEAKNEADEKIERQNNGGKLDTNSEAARKRAAESYALEMQIHIKRAERERKKKELEAEFAAVFQEVEHKKKELRHLEENIHDMEGTRKRKEREFQRLQRNLMELLQEQKNELDNLREKGIELEAATATSAAAAQATALAAKENEERSKAMFSSTEELLKFQFMSMSLSYFSSMNMLKSLRDINSDTTNAAVSSSADTAAAAAAAAQAANIPSVMNTTIGKGIASADLKKKKTQLERQKEIDEAKKNLEKPFHEDMRKWTVQDVGRWLETLSLGQYKKSFEEACIDGEFLLELRCEDMRDILGMKHQLHVQKVDLAREKLRPLNAKETKRKEAVEWEARGDKRREELQGQPNEELAPDVSAVFSQIRNGRYGRVEKALDAGFDPNDTDSHGNTALIIAAQNLNKRICELLINRGANVNYQNSQGNTAMHYAMAYEPEGNIGEFLIGRGADDSIVSKLGLTPYDGIE